MSAVSQAFAALAALASAIVSRLVCLHIQIAHVVYLDTVGENENVRKER